MSVFMLQLHTEELMSSNKVLHITGIMKCVTAIIFTSLSGEAATTTPPVRVSSSRGANTGWMWVLVQPACEELFSEAEEAVSTKRH